MTTGLARHAEFAHQLESELDEYPDERGEILLEAGDAWHRAGHPQRAIELLAEAVALGGENGGNARVGLAEVLFGLGQDEEARAQLEALRAARPMSPVPWHMAAELLEHRGELDQALIWFTAASPGSATRRWPRATSGSPTPTRCSQVVGGFAVRWDNQRTTWTTPWPR